MKAEEDARNKARRSARATETLDLLADWWELRDAFRRYYAERSVPGISAAPGQNPEAAMEPPEDA